MTSGVADLTLTIASQGYHGLYIEVKTPIGKQSPTQRKWQQLVEAQGYRYVIVRSLDEFVTTINNYIYGTDSDKKDRPGK